MKTLVVVCPSKIEARRDAKDFVEKVNIFNRISKVHSMKILNHDPYFTKFDVVNGANDLQDFVEIRFVAKYDFEKETIEDNMIVFNAHTLTKEVEQHNIAWLWNVLLPYAILETNGYNKLEKRERYEAIDRMNDQVNTIWQEQLQQEANDAMRARLRNRFGN